MIVFQPNVYDNNKILYIGYLFLCLLTADYLVEIVKKISKRALQAAVLAAVLLVSSISAILTMGRELVSDYQLYSADVILTDTRYNNEVVSLTGRNIVCGSSSFLYYHGLDYQTQEDDVAYMYQNPQDKKLFDKYDVKYVYLSDSERYSYSVTREEEFLKYFEIVHQEGNVVLYRRLAE